MKEQKFLEFWSKKKRPGFLKYCLRDGLLQWGVMTGILFFFLNNFLHDYAFTWEKLLRNVLIFSVVGGIFYGPLTWYFNEKKFIKLSNKDLRINHLIDN